jgi:NADPH-dependent ferric siderophore reductase
MSDGTTSARVRRAAAPFLPVAVVRTERPTPRMVRVTLSGESLAGFEQPQPAASIRLLVPQGPGVDLVLPTWAGNEWLLPDGRRAKEWIRTYTPGGFRPDASPTPELDVDVVLHGGGVTSDWAERAAPGDAAAVSGPQRGYEPDPRAPAFLLGGDESAVPAIRQVLAAIPPGIPVEVHVEMTSPDAELPLGDGPRAAVTWHLADPSAPPGSALVAAIEAAEPAPGAKVWVAGEAASVQRVRKHLFEARGLARTDAHVRGYWKHGRAGDDEAG